MGWVCYFIDKRKIVKKQVVMRKIVLILMIIVGASLGSFAQTDSTTTEGDGWKQKTLFSSGTGKIEHGFYGGLMTRYGQVNGQSALLLGGKGAWLINHSIGVGIAGNSLMNRTYTSVNHDVVGGYAGGNGGFMIEPILFADRPLHVALPVVVGGGFIRGLLKINSLSFS